MKVETKNKKSGLHRFLMYREDFWAPKGTHRAPVGSKKGQRVLKHHQTTFYEGRNKKQKILVASIFHVYTSLKGLKTGFWKKGTDPFFRISKNKKKCLQVRPRWVQRPKNFTQLTKTTACRSRTTNKQTLENASLCEITSLYAVKRRKVKEMVTTKFCYQNRAAIADWQCGRCCCWEV